MGWIALAIQEETNVIITMSYKQVDKGGSPPCILGRLGGGDND